MDLISMFDSSSYVKCIACERMVNKDSFYVMDKDIGICSSCHTHLPFVPIGTVFEERNSSVDFTLSTFFYMPPIRNMIIDFKFRYCSHYGKLLGKYMADYIQPIIDAGMSPDLVVPVPLSPKGMKDRGYNQAEILSQAISESLGLYNCTNALSRLHSRVKQSSLPPWKRGEHLKKLFYADENVVSDKRILLIDDVYTTGNTVRACANALKKAGAESIYVYTLSRRFNLRKSPEYNDLLNR